jgi:hypothetical protein
MVMPLSGSTQMVVAPDWRVTQWPRWSSVLGPAVVHVWIGGRRIRPPHLRDADRRGPPSTCRCLAHAPPPWRSTAEEVSRLPNTSAIEGPHEEHGVVKTEALIRKHANSSH